ncbi:L-lactate dehydrogenase complex protein LldG [Larkinella arboricola]|uniref:L-lactate dehydrogenase complex protein LldG n=1 Tax=Larkinella arboricola TaxID=643671 RepID=A0A327WU19_LARAB|nr:LUD domain-containing protein [Larkinella arboricola]RAJ95910.1 L-lactate dehydrogenase complex protein LldG [Larkinella arboricola]
MNSRERILAAVRQNKPELQPLPETTTFVSDFPDLVAKFCEILRFIGGTPVVVANYQEAEQYIRQTYGDLSNIVSKVPVLESLATTQWDVEDPHQLEAVDLAIIQGVFGVAENSAIWVPEERGGHRVLPFICQHLVLILNASDLVPNMHDAYQRLNVGEAGFGVFIAGPSKTADIEQALVIGAHGARSLSVVLLQNT